jgi:hypothetical protein
MLSLVCSVFLRIPIESKICHEKVV